MMEIELSSLDLRYEGYRMRNRAGEARLLASIGERGIVEPLEGVEVEQRHVLLNGFKRWRCARRLGLGTAPYVSLGEDAAMGIVALLRASNDRALSLLEQAGFVDELKRLHGMNVAEIAEALARSKAWVSLRLGLLAEMSPAVRQKSVALSTPASSKMSAVITTGPSRRIWPGTTKRSSTALRSCTLGGRSSMNSVASRRTARCWSAKRRRASSLR